MALNIDGDPGDFVHTVITECAVAFFYDETDMSFYSTTIRLQLSEEDFIFVYVTEKLEARERVKEWRAEHES